MSLTIQAAERALLPDASIRWGIRRLLRKRLSELRDRARQSQQAVPSDWLQQMRDSAIAIETDSANEQHYEVPAEFYTLCLGHHLKYSSCYWDESTQNLSQAEARMLELTCERAQLTDGQTVLELGCGWGSLSLWMAERYPNSQILSVSNSAGQRQYIEARAADRGLTNLEVRTVNINNFQPEGKFDRVVSVEMFEHMRNWEALLTSISQWLESDGKLFLHYFSHRTTSYPFENRGDDDWMARHFFTGGMMPSHDMAHHLEIPLEVEKDWAELGVHYSQTAEAWLKNLDRNRDRALEVLQQAGYNPQRAAERQLQRWRIFFLSCAELFGYHQGSEWLVSHVLLRNQRTGESR